MITMPTKGPKFTYHGITLPVRAWAAMANLPYTTLRSRMTSGWTFAEATTTPYGETRKSVLQYRSDCKQDHEEIERLRKQKNRRMPPFTYVTRKKIN